MPPLILLLGGVFAIFSAFLVTLAAMGVFASAGAARASRSLELITAYSSAPKPMKAELEPGFNDRVMSPLLTRLTAIGRRLTPADHADRLREKIEAAGNPAGWTSDRILAFKAAGFAILLVASVLLCLTLGIGFGPTLILVIGASLVGYMAPNLWLYQKAYDRAKLAQNALPDALDLLTISVEAGLGFDAALAQVARNTDGPLAEEFARLLQEMQLGAGRSQALRAMADRTRVADVKGFVSAMVQADAFGIPIGNVLRVQSQEMRTKRRQRAEEKAQKVPVKVLFPLMFCILPCLFIAVMGPGVISLLGSFGGMGL
jgi:tight adherence protein C